MWMQLEPEAGLPCRVMGWGHSAVLPGLLLSLLVLCLSPPGGMSPSAPAVLLLTQGLGTDEVKLNLKQTQTLVWYQCKKKYIKLMYCEYRLEAGAVKGRT